MSFSGRTSQATRKELKTLCDFFDNINMDYVRDTLHNRDHPGIKLQALQKPVGYDIYAGPNCISYTKYDVIKKKDCSDDWMNTAKNIVAKMINKDTHLCEEWIRIVTKSATLSSSSISYLQNIWSISQNINSAKTKNRQLFYNLESNRDLH